MNARVKPGLRQPRLAFLGVGWIGRQRAQVLADSGVATVAAIADSHEGALQEAIGCAPHARIAHDLDELLSTPDLDGVVIATPSGAHARQSIQALEQGLAVFCQKPLTRTAAEAEAVVAAAKRADRLIDVDFSYRCVAGVPELRRLVQSGELGDIYGVDLVFHNAYGPDKPWFYDMSQSGGGCVMDLGIHLLDLAAWVTGSRGADLIDAQLFAQGRALERPVQAVEDYASVQWRLDSGACARMACSWRLPAGCDAVIEASFYGTRGGAAMRNVNGSFYDFHVDRFDGTATRPLATPPDAWGGRALVDWARRLADGGAYDAGAEQLVETARLVDRIYGR